MKAEGYAMAITDSVNSSDIFNDKIAFANYMTSQGLEENIPRTLKTVDEVTFPVIVKFKPSFSTDHHGVRYYNDGKSFNRAMASYFRPNGTFSSKILVQEAVESYEEYAYSFVAYKGVLLTIDRCTIFSYYKNITLSYKYARDKQYYRCDDASMPGWSTISQIVHRLVADFTFDGVGCLEYRISPVDNKAKIVDFNPFVCRELSYDNQVDTLAMFVRSWWWTFLHDK